VSDQHAYRLFEQRAEGLEELGSGGAVYYAVVAAEGNIHGLNGLHFAVHYANRVFNGTNGHDAGIGRIDDGCERVDAEHAEVADSEGVTCPILRLQLLFFGLLAVFLHFGADLAEALLVGKAHHRYEEAFFHGHRDADMDMVVVADLGAEPGAVHLWMLAQRSGDSLHHEVVHADLDFADGVELFAGGNGIVHIDLDVEVEMGRAEFAFAEACGNGFAHLRQGISS